MQAKESSWEARLKSDSAHIHTVLAVSKCIKHDETWNTVLKCVGMKIWCGTCRFDTGTQCWVHRSVLRLPILPECSKGGHLEGGMPKRREIWLFQGANMDETAWNFDARIQSPWPTISTGIHSPGLRVPWASMQKPLVRVERLLHSVKQEKESERVTLWHVNRTHWWQPGNLKAAQIIITSIERWQSGALQSWSDSEVSREGSLDLPFLSILVPKWAALTLTLYTQHCVPVSHLQVPHQISTPTRFSTVFQVLSCSTQSLLARTVHKRQLNNRR